MQRKNFSAIMLIPIRVKQTKMMLQVSCCSLNPLFHEISMFNPVHTCLILYTHV